jgi:hypothetical protein
MNPNRSEATGPVPGALRAWCGWIYSQADLAARTQPNGAQAWNGETPDWRDHCGMFERQLIEAAMAAGVFVITDP